MHRPPSERDPLLRNPGRDRVLGLSCRHAGRRVGAAADAVGGGLSGNSGRTGFAAKFRRADTSTHETAAVGGWYSADMVIRNAQK